MSKTPVLNHVLVGGASGKFDVHWRQGSRRLKSRATRAKWAPSGPFAGCDETLGVRFQFAQAGTHRSGCSPGC